MKSEQRRLIFGNASSSWVATLAGRSSHACGLWCCQGCRRSPSTVVLLHLVDLDALDRACTWSGGFVRLRHSARPAVWPREYASPLDDDTLTYASSQRCALARSKEQTDVRFVRMPPLCRTVHHGQRAVVSFRRRVSTVRACLQACIRLATSSLSDAVASTLALMRRNAPGRAPTNRSPAARLPDSLLSFIRSSS